LFGGGKGKGVLVLCWFRVRVQDREKLTGCGRDGRNTEAHPLRRPV